MPAAVHFDFTSQTPPALPSGCVDTLGTVVTANVTLGGSATVAAHGTVLPGPSQIATISSGVMDGSGGLTKSVVTWGITNVADSFQGIGVAWRSTLDTDPTTGTAYWLNVGTGGGEDGLAWRKFTAGSLTQVGTSAATYTNGHLYEVTVDHTGSGQPVFTLQDLTASQYWTGTAWQSGVATVAGLGSDSSITGQGFNTVSFYGSSATVRVTDYQVILPGPTSVTLTGPTTGTTGAESSAFTATLDAPATGGGAVVNLVSDGSGDLFHATVGGSSVTSITIASGSTSGTFLLVPGTAGARHVSITSAGLTVSGSPITYTSSDPAPATGITLSCPASVVIGTPATLTGTANGALSVNHVLVITDTSGLAVGNLTILSGHMTGTVSFTESRAGSWAFTAVDGGSLAVTGCGYTASVLVPLMTNVDLTSDFTGLVGTVGFTVYASSGSTYQARATAGVSEPQAGTGCYQATFLGVPGTWYGVVWDTGGSVPQFSGIDRVIRDVPPAVSIDGSGRVIAQPGGFDAIQIDAVNTSGGSVVLNARQTLAQILAMVGGLFSGASNQGGTITVTNTAASPTTRVIVVADKNGNRSAVTHNPPA